jgi:hypothetical protein
VHSPRRQHGPADRADRLSAVRHLLPVPDAGPRSPAIRLADKVTDIQRINTVLNRLMLDGSIATCSPLPTSMNSGNANTYDDLLTVIPGGHGPYDGHGEITRAEERRKRRRMQAIEFMIGQREARTGITRHNQGLDADTLNRPPPAWRCMQAAGQNIEEYLARNFAGAVAKLMRSSSR